MKFLFKYQLAFVLLAFTLNSQSVAYADAGVISVVSKAEIEQSVVNKEGKKEIQRMVATKVAPGSEVIYTISFTNTSTKSADHISVTNPVPAHTNYVDGSAFGSNASISYSVDNGKSYDLPSNLTIKTAEGGSRPALASDYTNLRWVYKGSLAAGKVDSVGFKARVQ